MQSKLQRTISSPKQGASTHCKIHQDQKHSSVSHPLLLVTRHLVATLHQGQTRGMGHDTPLLQLWQASPLQVLDRKCQLTHKEQATVQD